VEHEGDAESAETLAEVVELLREDLERVRAKIANALLGPVHQALIPVVRRAQKDAQKDVPVVRGIRAIQAKDGSWSGTATELLTRLRRAIPDLVHDKDFPRDQVDLRSWITEAAPTLRALGISIKSSRKSTPGERGGQETLTIRSTGTATPVTVEDREESVQDLAQDALRTLGFSATREQVGAFILDRQAMRDLEGPSQAAAHALALAAGLGKERDLYRATAAAALQPALPVAMNRWIPRGVVREFLNALLDEEDKRYRERPVLPLAALGAGEPAGPVIARREHDFKEKLRRQLVADRDVLKELFRSLLSGNAPAPGFKLTPEQEVAWSAAQQHFVALGAEVAKTSSPAEVDALANAFADWFTGWIAATHELGEMPNSAGQRLSVEPPRE
jgi:hypothetical protein